MDNTWSNTVPCPLSTPPLLPSTRHSHSSVNSKVTWFLLRWQWSSLSTAVLATFQSSIELQSFFIPMFHRVRNTEPLAAAKDFSLVHGVMKKWGPCKLGNKRRKDLSPWRRRTLPTNIAMAGSLGMPGPSRFWIQGWKGTKTTSLFPRWRKTVWLSYCEHSPWPRMFLVWTTTNQTYPNISHFTDLFLGRFPSICISRSALCLWFAFQKPPKKCLKNNPRRPSSKAKNEKNIEKNIQKVEQNQLPQGPRFPQRLALLTTPETRMALPIITKVSQQFAKIMPHTSHLSQRKKTNLPPLKPPSLAQTTTLYLSFWGKGTGKKLLKRSLCFFQGAFFNQKMFWKPKPTEVTPHPAKSDGANLRGQLGPAVFHVSLAARRSGG